MKVLVSMLSRVSFDSLDLGPSKHLTRPCAPFVVFQEMRLYVAQKVEGMGSTVTNKLNTTSILFS